MRKLYLIRHGAPDFAPGAHICLGHTDTPLGPLGRMQACLLGEELREAAFSAVFSSPLSRAVQTARFLSPEPVPLEGFEELSTGDWDGLDFADIRRRWPEHYAARGADPGLPPPNGEKVADGQRRFLRAVRQALSRSEGTIAIVAHRSVNRSLLCHVLGVPVDAGGQFRFPYGSYCVLEVDADRFRLLKTACLPHPPLTSALAESLLAAAGTPERVRAHCRAVATEAARLADLLPLTLDRELLTCAALLHDLARTKRDHAKTGAIWLRDLGYESAAELVEQHHDLMKAELNEAALLFLADKRVQGMEVVSIEERFARSEKQCRTAEARAAWRRRFEMTQQIRAQVNLLVGRRIL